MIRPAAPSTCPSCTWPATPTTPAGSPCRRCGTRRRGGWSATTTRRSAWICPPSGAPITGQARRSYIPQVLREEIDEVNGLVYADVNNGVYKAGFATGQEAYEQAYDALFARLDWLSERLRTQRYLVGGQLTEADVRLFTTLVRFDAVYHGHFKCNRNKLAEQPVLWDYARDLFQTPGFGETVDFDHIKRHYYATHDAINPTRIVPKGPRMDGWSRAARLARASADPPPNRIGCIRVRQSNLHAPDSVLPQLTRR